MLSIFDYIVVGGGASGAVVAARLAERLPASVCLLEAGPTDEGVEEVHDYRRWPELLGSALDYDYAIEPQERGNSALRHARGRILGGSSSINGAAAIVPPPEDMRAWVDAGAAGWSPDETEPFFALVASQIGLDDAPRGNRCNQAFVESARACGFPEVEFNEASFGEGVGWFQLHAHGSSRRSSSVAYLHPLAAQPPNLTIRTGVVAQRLELADDGRAVAVETDHGRFVADREIIVCCGAIETPKLLMLSGLGAEAELSKVGIETRVDLPAVGENLCDHAEGQVVWTSNREVPGSEEGAWVTGLFARTDPSLSAPDVMLHFGTEVYQFETTLPSPPPPAPAKRSFCITPNVPRPKSRGRVALRSGDPAAPPIVDPRYFTDPDGYDEAILLHGIELARRVAASGPLADWVEAEIWPGDGNEAELSEKVRRSAGTVFHPAGTARMGAAGDGDVVVDPTLRVRGTTGLRIADASVFPRMIGVNPVMTCMMIGEKCAALVAGDAQASSP